MTLQQRLKMTEGVIYAGIWEKSDEGGKNCKCKDLEAKVCLACLMNSMRLCGWNIMSLRAELKIRLEFMGPHCVALFRLCWDFAFYSR
jgi:hypothetical protein